MVNHDPILINQTWTFNLYFYIYQFVVSTTVATLPTAPEVHTASVMEGGVVMLMSSPGLNRCSQLQRGEAGHLLRERGARGQRETKQTDHFHSSSLSQHQHPTWLQSVPSARRRSISVSEARLLCSRLLNLLLFFGSWWWSRSFANEQGSCPDRGAVALAACCLKCCCFFK